ncbi:hypothetical protein K443DRAFT_459107 [Laccaria amethystina LaAM-08-1]|uniref:Uncharacterized protein n=1 Tax=Laccaria amethystina LaAM-08-1 TaxID=1095629 RepID=A0A0C9X6S3_9AGAR|nr:hypothetical protein K443DRAFT_459107 [Laccaria amethystina LaAM-08-1]
MAAPHPAVMYVISERCVEALEVHRAGWGGSGLGAGPWKTPTGQRHVVHFLIVVILVVAKQSS